MYRLATMHSARDARTYRRQVFIRPTAERLAKMDNCAILSANKLVYKRLLTFRKTQFDFKFENIPVAALAVESYEGRCKCL